MSLLQNNSFQAGLKDSISFGFAFIFFVHSDWGIGASQNLSFMEVVATSLLIFSTPLQFILVQSYEAGLTLLPMILALNSRFILMSSALSLCPKQTSIKKNHGIKRLNRAIGFFGKHFSL